MKSIENLKQWGERGVEKFFLRDVIYKRLPTKNHDLKSRNNKKNSAKPEVINF